MRKLDPQVKRLLPGKSKNNNPLLKIHSRFFVPSAIEKLIIPSLCKINVI